MAGKADMIIIGGGPGGYVAALRAAQLGARVALIERDRVGGTCLHRGCIPTKALLEVARAVRSLARLGDLGIRVAGWEVDLGQVRRFRDRPVRMLARGVESLLEAAGVEVVRGEARLSAPGRVEVFAPEGGAAAVLEAARLVIAAGSLPAPLPLPGGEHCWDSDAAVALPEVPRRLAVVGGGPVGVEMASVYAALGAEVTVVEFLPRLLPREDADVGEALGRALGRQGIRVLTGTRVTALEPAAEGGFRLSLAAAPPEGATVAAGGGTPAVLEADRVLVAVGRRPAVRGLGLNRLGLPEGWIQTDDAGRTAVPGVYAVGDVAGRSLLAHAASAQGIAAAEHALGHAPTVRLDVVPSCTFTRPEVASVGLTEEAARSRGEDVRVGRFPFSANGKASAMGERDGFVKVVAARGSRRLLGVHVFGPDASTLIHEAALALAANLTLADVERTIHAHPTLSESFAEACLAAEGRAIHLPGAGGGVL